MIRWALPLAIAGFWSVMMGMLAEREILPLFEELREAAQGPSFRRVLKPTDGPTRTHMGIYRHGRRVGETTTEVELMKTAQFWRIRNKTSLTAAVLGEKFGSYTAMRSKFEAKVGSDFRLLSFELEVFLGLMNKPHMTIYGHVVGSTLRLVTRIGGHKTERFIPYDARYPISPGMSPLFGVPDLYVGRRWRLRTVSPLTMDVTSAWAEVVGKERMSVGDREIDAFEVKVEHQMLETSIWISDVGEVLKQTAPLGFTLLTEPPGDTDKHSGAAPRKP